MSSEICSDSGLNPTPDAEMREGKWRGISGIEREKRKYGEKGGEGRM